MEGFCSFIRQRDTLCCTWLTHHKLDMQVKVKLMTPIISHATYPGSHVTWKCLDTNQAYSCDYMTNNSYVGNEQV